MTEGTGFLNDLRLSNAPDDPNHIPEGKYPAFVSDLKIITVGPKKDATTGQMKPASKALIISYKVTADDPDNFGKTKSEFKTLPEVDEEGNYKTPDDKKNASYLRQRMLSLGVPENKLDTMKREELLGTPVWMEIRESGGYYNIKGPPPGYGIEQREEEVTFGQL